MRLFMSKIAGTVFVAVMMLMLITACNDKISYVPIIKSVVVFPDTVITNDSAMLLVVAFDEDDEDLVYSYTTSGGTILGFGDSVTWIAPNTPGSFITKVLITDNDGNQATTDINHFVLKDDSVSQLYGVAAFSSAIEADLVDSKVRIYSSLVNMSNHEYIAETSVSGFGTIVNFKFENLEPGTYYLEVWKDMDFGNTYNIGDYYGWYGFGNYDNRNPIALKLLPGESKEIQLQMWIIPQ